MKIFYMFHPIYAEVFLLLVTCVVLLMSTAKGEKYKDFCYLLTQMGLIGSLIISSLLFFQLPQYLFSHHYLLDSLSSFLKIFIYITTYGVIVYAKPYLQSRNIPEGEFYALVLFSVLGMQIFVSAGSLLTLYLGLEILSLPIYALIAIEQKVTQRAEAAIKYFVMGAIASGLFLYGISLLYGLTQTLDFNIIAQKIALLKEPYPYMLLFSLAFILAGIAFKLGLVPFHIWVPDVYQGASNVVTAFITSASKIAAMAFVFRLLFQALPSLIAHWQTLLMILAILSFMLGNFTAIAQTNLKRMLAYSSISHVGYLALGLMLGTKSGYASALFYMVMYALMSLGAFGILSLLSGKEYDIENIQDLQGLNSKNSWIALMMLFLMFSMAGIPPFCRVYSEA